MAEYFTPSPRLSKRRKLGTYGDGMDRTTIEVPSPTETAKSKLGIVADTHPENSTKSVGTKTRIDEHERLNPGRATNGIKVDNNVEARTPNSRKGRSKELNGNVELPQKSGSNSVRSTRRSKQTVQDAREVKDATDEQEKEDRSLRRAQTRIEEGLEDAEDVLAPSMYEQIVQTVDSAQRPLETAVAQAEGSKTAPESSEVRHQRRKTKTSDVRNDEERQRVRVDEALLNTTNGERQLDHDGTKIRRSGRTIRHSRAAEEVDPNQRPRDAAPIPSTTPSKRKAEQQPKSILTPSRRDRNNVNQIRKSVVFDEQERAIEEDLGFKDISPSSKKARGSPRIREKEIVLREQELDPEFDEHTSVEELSPLGRLAAEAHGLLTPRPDHSLDLGFEDDNPEATFDTDLPEVDEDPHITSIKQIILARLVSKHSAPPMTNLQTQYDSLHALLSATVTAGESNSLLLLGSRGSGKSLIIETALTDLLQSHASDFHVVRLNGFFQTDDKLALREIWRQLGREMQVSEDETGEVSSYADTMASLLSLLSHPEDFEIDPDVTRGEGQNVAKSVIFILDEFDLFTTHPRQTLLYNLFDIAQSRKAPIAVIGCSTRMDVVDCLEKRVKSRFSHRWLHVPRAKNLREFEDAVTAILCLDIDGDDALMLGEEDLTWRKEWNDHITTSFLPNPQIQSLIQQTFHSTRSLPSLHSALFIPIATLTLPNHSPSDSVTPKLTSTTISIPPTAPPTLLNLLPTLPLVHLSLLVSATRLHTLHSFPSIPFQTVYKHHTDLIQRSKLSSSSSLRLWGQEVAKAAWEELGVLEVIMPAGTEGAWKCDCALEEVSWALKVKGRKGEGAAGCKEWERWCKEV